MKLEYTDTKENQLKLLEIKIIIILKKSWQKEKIVKEKLYELGQVN